MPSDSIDRSTSFLSAESQPEDDWDRSLVLEGDSSSLAIPLEISSTDSAMISQLSRTTPRNSVVFPAEGTPGRATHYSSSAHSKNGSIDELEVGNKKRTLSDLLKLHSERGTNGEFSPDEAKRIADVLGQWINASSSPYEGEDDFFTRHAQDDINLNASRRVSGMQSDHAGRPRGKSESINSNANAGSRSPSVLGATAA